MSDFTIAKEMMAAGPGCAIANGMLNGFETTKVKLQLHNNAVARVSSSLPHPVQHPPQQPQHLPLISHSHHPSTMHHSHPQHHHNRLLHTSHLPRSSSVVVPHATTAPRIVYPNATMVGVMSQIAREEGIVRGLLTPGLSASLTRSMLYGAYRVGLYPTVRETVTRYTTPPTTTNNSNNHSSALLIQQRILSGMITGGLGSMISCPLDVVRTRMQADAGVIVKRPRSSNAATNAYVYTTGLRQGQPVRYTGLWSALSTIFKEEGLSQGLYRGASVTITRACVLNGAQLASYDSLKQYALHNNNSYYFSNNAEEESPLLHVVCAFASGVLAQTVIMPMDTIKSHMMLGKGWKDMIGEVVATRRARLIPWLYRGYAPACAGQGLIMVLQMPLIEAFRKQLGVGAI